MNVRRMMVAAVGIGLIALTSQAMAQNPRSAQLGGPQGPGAAVGPVAPMDVTWSAFSNTLTRMNMSPDFTLDKDTKAKIIALGKELTEAREKYAADHKDEISELNKAFSTPNQSREAMTENVKKYQEFWSKAPKGEDYIAKAKALLTPDQLKALDADAQRGRKPRENEPRRGS